jgi:hypothetical protein
MFEPQNTVTSSPKAALEVGTYNVEELFPHFHLASAQSHLTLTLNGLVREEGKEEAEEQCHLLQRAPNINKSNAANTSLGHGRPSFLTKWM